MIIDGYCRYGVKCAYKHHLRNESHRENTNEDIKKIKAKLDVLKNTVKTLVSIKEECQKVEMDVKHVKEEISTLSQGGLQPQWRALQDILNDSFIC